MKTYLCNESFTHFAAENYNNVVIDPVEFQDDLDRIKYIKRLFNKYRSGGELKERLVINHLIILYNVFDSQAVTKMLFYKLEGFHEYLKPFLVWLRRLPDEIPNYSSKRPTLSTAEISMNESIVETLRKITRNA
jgi:hypothetical protein